MQSEEFDKKIKEAADHHHPAYDEQAWMKMEKLLDKHLPQKKDDRRRFIFFLLLFLLLGGGAAILFFTSNGRKNYQSSIADSRATVQQPSPSTTGKNEPSPTQENKNNNADIDNNEPVRSNTVNNNTSPSNNSTTTGDDKIPVKDVGKKEQKTKTGISNNGNTDYNTNSPLTTDMDKSISPGKEKNNFQVPDVFDPWKTNSNKSTVVINPAIGSMEKEDKNVDQSVTNNATTQINDPAKKEKVTVLQNPAEKPIKIKKSKKSSFSLNFSAGPDVSNTGFSKPGKMNLLAGLGLGYTYKERFTIRTGFYAGNKVYTASPGDYHPPSRFYYYYPNLEKIDANCRVYEIPISLSYNFGHTRKQNWFVSSGVSSYLMKRETYNYFYKAAPTEPTITRKRTLLGVNKHYFSVLTLSAGYQKNISKSVSMTVEPYFKLPVGGIGYGKVKLKSSGVLFTLGVKPFDLFKKGK